MQETLNLFKFTHQAVYSEVKESTRGEGKALFQVNRTHVATNHCSNHGTNCGKKLETEDLADAIVQLEQNCKITDLVRNFVEQHGHSRHNSEAIV